MSFAVMDPATLGSAIAAGLFVGILVCLEAGRWIGNRAIGRHGAGHQPGMSSLEGAVFALMGLLIAFTFSGALTRFDERRAQVVSEANAIGTAWLRIDLLPAAAQPKLRDTFREYVDARIATYKKLPDMAAAKQELARSLKLQSEIWAQAAAAMRLPDTRTSAEVLMMGALNEMFDITTTRVAATQIHPPNIVYAMLIGLALAAALLAGYQSAGDKRRDWIHQLGFAAILSLTLYVILDIEHPRLGLVRIDAIDQVLIDVRAGMK
jgi:hypothetical protein